MTRVILHVGSEKTGSTALQKCLSKRLSDRGGPYYVAVGQNPGGAHHGIYRALNSPDGEQTIEQLISDMSGAQTAIISCEHFSNMSDNAFGSLGRFAGIAADNGWSVHLVAVIREAFSFLRSLYFESLKWGTTLTYDQYVPKTLKHLHAVRLRDAAENFGWSSSFIRYDPDNLLADFLAATNLPKIETNDLARENVSTPTWTAPLLLQLNRQFGNPAFTRSVRNLISSHSLNQPADMDTDAFFALPIGTSDQIRAIEMSDPVRRQLFSPENTPA